MMREAAQQAGQTEDEVFTTILVNWNKRMPLVTGLGRRKVLGLALSSLLTVQSRYGICIKMNKSLLFL